MHPKFSVSLLKSSALLNIPGDWTTNDYQNILELTDYGDTAGMEPAELEEMALMSLADLPKHESAELLMNYAFPEEALTQGQIKNASHEMDSEKLWEEYPEPPQHRNFFRVGSLLYRAYNGGFPKPDARFLAISVSPLKGGEDLLVSPSPAFVARLLAGGMNDHALLHRLYDDELTGEHFEAATNIIWSVSSTRVEDGSFRLEVLSSDYWLEAYDPREAYECVAYPDADPEEED